MNPHMVEQVIKYSDGSETVIKYRGVIVNGELQLEKGDEEKKEAKNETKKVAKKKKV